MLLSVAVVGELAYILERGLVENRLCSCGVPFRECPVWLEVLKQAFGGTVESTQKSGIACVEAGCAPGTCCPFLDLGARRKGSPDGRAPIDIRGALSCRSICQSEQGEAR
jgi:hypothetical protein